MKELRVSVAEVKERCGAKHKVGDSFYIRGKGRLVSTDDKGICVYALSSLLPFLMLKQRESAPGEDDWVPEIKYLSCPDALGVVFEITVV
ncbi:MAG: TIGR04076 family protein [Deltaproteobacteria bacterium]|nr:TIGR04076 family protein [Deltaproteobacteria bacterium]